MILKAPIVITVQIGYIVVAVRVFKHRILLRCFTFVCSSIRQPVRLPVRSSICLSVYRSICLFVCFFFVFKNFCRSNCRHHCIYPWTLPHAQYDKCGDNSFFIFYSTKTASYLWSIDSIERQYTDLFFTQLYLKFHDFRTLGILI